METNVAINGNRGVRIVVFPESRQWAIRESGDFCRLESIPDIMETTLFRLSPGMDVPLTAHREDREILVLEGALDLGGRTWTKGAYLRLSGESSRTSLKAREEGCLLFLKAGQFPEGDRESTGFQPEDGSWRPGLVDGLNVLPLFSGGTANTALVRWDPGTVFQPHRHFGGEEILVLSGVFEDELGTYPAGTWIRSPHMSRHDPFSTPGCTIFVKTGHMLDREQP
ncbi:MAG: cupin domain-containing protein [Nitrospirota bacterium]|nr:cupin domain-containing protein [Nitrospirota bacterium]